jgi:hypothetical protein
MTIRPFFWAIYIGQFPRGESLVTARQSMGDDLKFKHPFSCLLGSPSGSGKTSFCIRFLQNLQTLCTLPEFSGGFVWQLAGNKHVRFHEVVPADLKNSGEIPCPIIPEDLLNSAY